MSHGDDAIRLEIVPADGAPELVAFAQQLTGEYAAMPHTTGRWNTAAADIAALPHPYVAPHGLLLVAMDGDTPLACGALRAVPELDAAELKRVYVRTEARGRGIGEAIVRALIADAERRQCARVLLDTAEELHAALALYHRLGFHEIPHYRDGHMPGSLSFEKRLRP